MSISLEARREYYSKNKQKISVQNKIYRVKHAKTLKARKAKQYADSRNKTIERVKKYAQNNVLVIKLRMAKLRAFKKNLPFNIELSDLTIPTACICCGATNYVPSIDKVINDLGYVKGNVAIICNPCNILKRDGTSEQHRNIANYIDKFVRKQRLV